MAEFTKILEIRKRMCSLHERCLECPLALHLNVKNIYCEDFLLNHPKEAEEILLTWDKEHPVKTRLMDFLEKYPNAKLRENGIPISCAKHLGYCEQCPYDFVGAKCGRCWNTPLED